MGRKVDLSALTKDEAQHVLKVVRRDMKLRKKEENRLSDLMHELEEEGEQCLLLAKQRGFNKQCCIRCCGPFSFILKPRRVCLDCHYNVCKACCSYCQHNNGYICAFCHKSRLLRAQSLEWYYNNVKSRFKRFGSAKILKILYKKHITERGALLELPEINAPECSNDNNGSMCGSDSVFSKESKSHSITETITVALRAAEEAIEEAITKAEGYRDSLEKQNEARYLHDHREELIEELAITILQKIINRGKQCSEMAEYDFVWSQSTLASSTTSQPCSITQAYGKKIWRSLSALYLTSDDFPNKSPVAEKLSEAAEPETNLKIYSSLRKESRASILGRKNVDRLDNSSASSVLQSPDGNWIALQTSQHSRPSLLTKRKSLVFSVLEKESGVVSAYDEIVSDLEDEAECDSWGLALLQFRQRLSEETLSTNYQNDAKHYPLISLPSLSHFTNTETLISDSKNSLAHPTQTHIPVYNVTQKSKTLSEPCLPFMLYEHNRPAVRLSYSPKFGALEVNFNPQVVGDSSEGEDRAEQIQRLQCRKWNKHNSAEQRCVHNVLYTGENSTLLLSNMMMKGQNSLETLSPFLPPTYQLPDTVTQLTHVTSTDLTPKFVYKNIVASNSVHPSSLMYTQLENDTLDNELISKLSELMYQISKEESTTSDDEPIQKVIDGRSKKQRDIVTQKERKNESQKESYGKLEMGRNEMKMERLSEKWFQKQLSKESHEGDVEQREKKKKREGSGKIETQMEKQDSEQQKTERQRQVEKCWQVRESKNERKEENMKLVEIEPHVNTQGNEHSRLNLIKDLQESETQQVTIITVKTKEARVDIKKSVKEQHRGKGHYLTEDYVKKGLLQRSKLKRDSKNKSEANSHSTSDPVEQTSPTEVYLAAGTVYGLEGELTDLDDFARSISSSTTKTELAYLEDQVATAAVKVQQTELQISDIEARISALKNAGLNISVCSRFPKHKPQLLDSSRLQRRKLPAPPAENSEASQDLCSHKSNSHNPHSVL